MKPALAKELFGTSARVACDGAVESKRMISGRFSSESPAREIVWLLSQTAAVERPLSGGGSGRRSTITREDKE